MALTHFQIIIEKVKWSITSKEDALTDKAHRAGAIVKRFIKLMWDSVLRGNEVNIHHGTSFYLDMEPARELTEEEKKRYRSSSRKFGYIFSIKWRDKTNLHEQWIFYPEPEIMKRLEELLESDKIYELTKV